MSIEVTDELIQKLTEEWLDTLPERYPLKPKHPYRFSPGFSLKMRWLCHKADWDYACGKDLSHFGEVQRIHWTKRTAAALLAAALGTTVAMAYAVRYFQMVREDHEKYSSVFYRQIEEGYIPEEFVCYTLGYVPEGYILNQEVTIGEFHEEVYCNAENESAVLVFHQIRIDQATVDIDTEKMAPVEIQLNDHQQAWYLDNPSRKIVYWDDGKYFFQVSGELPKVELVKIANSISQK